MCALKVRTTNSVTCCARRISAGVCTGACCGAHCPARVGYETSTAKGCDVADAKLTAQYTNMPNNLERGTAYLAAMRMVCAVY